MSDLWTVDHDDPVLATEAKFRPSLVARAHLRTVTLDGDSWLVSGEQSLGDTYPSYRVTHIAANGTAGRYDCECHHHGHGSVRQHKLCSHTVAVALYRAVERKKKMAVARAKAKIAARREDGEEDARAGERLTVSPTSLPADSGTPLSGRDAGEEDDGCSAVAIVPSPRDPMFGQPGIPDWLTEFRPTQWQAIEQTLAHFANGKKVVFLQAPTGSGKSAVAKAIQALLAAKAIYVCTTKALQQQFLRDFDMASVLMGRANYPTLKGADAQTDLWGEVTGAKARNVKASNVTCADCTKGAGDDCRWCEPIAMCPYRMAKREAMTNRLTVLNTAYWLAAANHADMFNDRELVVIDECDEVEGAVMGLVEVRIGRQRVKQLGLSKPRYVTKPESWVEWITDEVAPKVEQRISELPAPHYPTTTPAQIRELSALQQLHEALGELIVKIPEGEWVLTGYDKGEYVFKPVKVNAWGQEKVWAHGKRFLLMSATIISAQEMAESLGLEEGEWGVVDVPMTFPVENRQIRVASVAPMTNKEKETSWPKMAEAVKSVISLHPDERILIHTVSYALTTYLRNFIRQYTGTDLPPRSTTTYTESREKERALAQYLAEDDAILFAPSMDRGVDLPGDACRVQIVTKVPYPNLGDKVVNARLHTKGGQLWYSVATARTLVQMTGRGVRSAEDHAVTYILDSSFSDGIWRRNRRLFPGWWRDALDFKWKLP